MRYEKGKSEDGTWRLNNEGAASPVCHLNSALVVLCLVVPSHLGGWSSFMQV